MKDFLGLKRNDTLISTINHTENQHEIKKKKKKKIKNKQKTNLSGLFPIWNLQPCSLFFPPSHGVQKIHLS
jgi:hypothetical protein